MPLPQVGWAFFRPISDTRLKHCRHNSPREGPGALWTTFLSHLETISMAREEKIRGWTRPGSSVQDWSQWEGPADVCQLKVPDEHKKSSLSFFFWLPPSFNPVCRLRCPLRSAGHSVTARSLVQIRLVRPSPCHHNIGSGSTSWSPVWHQFFPNENPNAAGFPPNVCKTYYIPLIKIMQRTRCLLFVILQITVVFEWPYLVFHCPCPLNSVLGCVFPHTTVFFFQIIFLDWTRTC